MELNKFFVKAPLVPVICQDERSGEVLMLGYADDLCRHAQGTGLSYGQPHLFFYNAVGERKAPVAGLPNCF